MAKPEQISSKRRSHNEPDEQDAWPLEGDFTREPDRTIDITNILERIDQVLE